MRKILVLFVGSAVLFMGIYLGVSNADEQPISFYKKSQRVIDLSRLLRDESTINKEVVIFMNIDDSTGVIGLTLSSGPKRRGDLWVLSPFNDEYYKRDSYEKPLIKKHNNVVYRSKNTLSISTKVGTTYNFSDWSIEPKDSDGDSEHFIFSGSMPKSGFHQVDALYGHDSPGSYLVNINTGKIFYTHTGSDFGSISRNSKKLFIMNDGLNPPFSFMVYDLMATGSGVELQCIGANNRKTKVIPFFKGWHVEPNIGFDVVLLVQKEEKGPYEAVPIINRLIDRKWHVFVPDPERFKQHANISCWQ